jgi:hypothetical protein
VLALGLLNTVKLSQGIASSGRVDVLAWLFETKLYNAVGFEAARAAFLVGSLPVLQWAQQRSGSTALSKAQRLALIRAAGRGGHVQLLAWSRATAVLWPANNVEQALLITSAAEKNCVSLLNWLHALGHDLQSVPGAVIIAAANSHYEALRFLCENGCTLGVHPDPRDSPDVQAALAGSLNILKCIRQQQPQRWNAQLLFHMIQCAGMAGHAHIVQYLHEQGASWPDRLWHADMEHQGSIVGLKSSCWGLPTLKYAVTAGCPWGAWRFGLCCELNACGYEAEVEWGHANGCPCGADCPAR